jgi:hypothetical protein
LQNNVDGGRQCITTTKPNAVAFNTQHRTIAYLQQSICPVPLLSSVPASFTPPPTHSPPPAPPTSF